MLHCDICCMWETAHLFVFLGRNGSQECTIWDPTPPGGTSPNSSLHSRQMTGQLFGLFNSQSLVASPGSVPVALAVAACILALLSLPLILVLVYKQRQTAQSGRRMYYWYAQTSSDTHTFPCSCYDSNINLSHWVPCSVLSDTRFLSVR